MFKKKDIKKDIEINKKENELIKFSDVQEFFMEHLGVCFNGSTYFRLSRAIPNPTFKSFNDFKHNSHAYFLFDREKSINDYGICRFTINEFEFKRFNEDLKLVKDYSNAWRIFCFNKYGDLYLNYCINIIESQENELYYKYQEKNIDLKEQIRNIENKRDKDLKWADKNKKKFSKKTKDVIDVEEFKNYVLSNSEERIEYIENVIADNTNELNKKIKNLENKKAQYNTLKNNLSETNTL